MTEQEKLEWIARNIDCFRNEKDAREDLEKRLVKKEAKEKRSLRIFENLDVFRIYEKEHKMGKWFTNEENKICAFEY